MSWSRISFWFAVVVFGLVTALWISPILLQLDSIPFWRNAAYSDLLVSHWPNAIFLNRAIKLWNQVPLWNPSILSGYPFFADPLAGVWYPPMWLAAVFPAPITFNVLFWIHLAFAGFGMFRLSKSEGLSDYAALVSGLVFAGIPKWIAHIGLGHIGLVSAVSWTPWLLLATREALTSASMSRPGTIGAFTKNGLLLALIFVSDPRWLLPSIILILLYLPHVLGALNLQISIRVAIAARWAGLTGLFALGGAAGFASALLVFVKRSTRTLIDSAAPDPFALSFQDLSELITFRPDHPETFIYLGLSALFLALLGVIFGRRKPLFWYGIIIVGLLISMGHNLPVLGDLLHALPGASLLRVPARWFFLVMLGVSYLAGSGFDALIEAPLRGKIFYRAILLLLFLGAAVYLAEVQFEGTRVDQTVILLIPAAALLPLILARRFGWLHAQTLLIAVAAVVSLEFGVVDHLILESRPVPVPVTEQNQELEPILKPYGAARTFSPSYSVDQLGGAYAGIELADGVHPLQLQSYWSYMARATGFEEGDYSVTLPPFPSGEPQDRWPVRLDIEALRRLNIHTVVSAYPLSDSGLSLLINDADYYVYTLDSPRPRAWVEISGSRSGEWLPAELTYWSPNRIELIAEGPGKLVLSELAYPGWQASINGKPASEHVVDGLLRGVLLEQGNHRVSFVYRPPHLFAGLAVTALTLLVALILWVKR